MKRHIIALVFGSLLASGCGDHQQGAPDAGGNTSALSICDGSAGIRLAVTVGGGGPIDPGTAMLTENGWRFLLVDGSCTAWIQISDNEPLRTTILSHDREQQLASELRLSDWAPLAGLHTGNCSDAPGITYRFGQQRVDGPTCGLRPDDPLEALNAAFAAQIADLATNATVFLGDLRYLVLPSTDLSGIDTRAPVAWPLDVPVESVALTEDQAFQYTRGGSRRATGADASRLRVIRTTMANGKAAGGGFFNFTVVVGASGTAYQLYVRDSVPFENDNGLLPSP